MLKMSGKKLFNGIIGLGSKENIIKRLHRQITKKAIINFSDPSSIFQVPALLSRFSKLKVFYFRKSDGFVKSPNKNIPNHYPDLEV